MRNQKSNPEEEARRSAGKWMLGIPLLLTAAGTAGLAGVGNYFINHALVPGGELDDAISNGPRAPRPEAAPALERMHQTMSEAYGRTARWLEDAGVQAKQITARDGVPLCADYVPGQGHHWAILCHGYQGSRHQGHVFAMHYAALGYHTLCPDLRAHGNSGGKFIGMGWLDRLDLISWIHWILRKDPEAEIVLHGHSMGGAAVLCACGEAELPAAVKACVSDCAYTSVWDIFSHVLDYRYHLPAKPVLNAVNTVFQLRGGYDLKQASPLEAVGRSRVPTLFIHGSADTFVPVWMGHALFAAARCPKQWLMVPDAPHARSQFMDEQTYYSTLTRFLREQGLL